jgi:hypothetical protein
VLPSRPFRQVKIKVFWDVTLWNWASVPEITGHRTAFVKGRVEEEMLGLLDSEGESTKIL